MGHGKGFVTVKAFVTYTYPDKKGRPKRHKRELFVDPSMDFVYAHHALVENPFDDPYIVAVSMHEGDMYICVANKDKEGRFS